MEGGRRASSTSDRDLQECAWPRASRHAGCHGKPGIDIPLSGPMEGGKRASSTSGGDLQEDTWPRASRHTDYHGKLGINILESRPMERGGRASTASDGDTQEGAGPEHPDALTGMANLAFIWKSQCRGVEAIDLLSECVEL